MFNDSSFHEYARLLSSSDIRIVYDDAIDTANYDVQTNTITMPILDFLDRESKHLMIAHEVGHAVYSTFSPEEILEHKEKYGIILNVVEDIRIENSLKRDYPGLKQIFDTGYTSLYRNRFFGDLETIPLHNLVSRLNFKFKIGNNIHIPFDESEYLIVYKAYSIYSNRDVLELCDELLKKCGKFSDTEGHEQELPLNADNLQKNIAIARKIFIEQKESEFKDLYEDLKSEHTTITQIPEIENFRTDILLNDITIEDILFDGTKYQLENYSILKNCKKYDVPKIIDGIDRRIKELKIASREGNSYFSMLKDARRNKLIRYRKTGSIDTRRLPYYKTSDKIFRNKKNVDKQQNHGVAIFLDYSGSMSENIDSAIEQTILVAEFCKNNGIRFEIFLIGAQIKTYDNYTWEYYTKTTKFDQSCIGQNWIVKIADEHTYKPEFLFLYGKKTQQVLDAIFTSPEYQNKPHTNLCMSMTPILRAAIVANHIVQNFISRGCDKTHVVMITDGENNDNYCPSRIDETSPGFMKFKIMYGKIQEKLGMTDPFDDSFYHNMFGCLASGNSEITVNGYTHFCNSSSRIHNIVIGAIFGYMKARYGTEIFYSYINFSSSLRLSADITNFPKFITQVCLEPEEVKGVVNQIGSVNKHNSEETRSFVYVPKNRNVVDKIIMEYFPKTRHSIITKGKRHKSLDSLYISNSHRNVFVRELAKSIA